MATPQWNDQFNINMEMIAKWAGYDAQEKGVYCNDCGKNPCTCKEADEYED